MDAPQCTTDALTKGSSTFSVERGDTYTRIWHSFWDHPAVGRLSHSAAVLFFEFVRAMECQKHKRGREVPIPFTYDGLKGRWKMCKKTFQRARRELVDAGIIRPVRRQTGLSNQYEFLLR